MDEKVFYTHVPMEPDILWFDLTDRIQFVRQQQGVVLVNHMAAGHSLVIVMAAQFNNIAYSRCPLPGSHDFAAGWLIYESMLRISKRLGRAIFWQEGRFYRESLRLQPETQRRLPRTIFDAHISHPIEREPKPPIIVDWWELETRE